MNFGIFVKCFVYNDMLWFILVYFGLIFHLSFLLSQSKVRGMVLIDRTLLKFYISVKKGYQSTKFPKSGTIYTFSTYVMYFFTGIY